MDEDLIREFDSLCNNLGLTMTSAINVFAKTVVRRKGIPFEISMDVRGNEDAGFDAELYARDPVFNRATQAELVRRAKDMDAGINCAFRDIIEVD